MKVNQTAIDLIKEFEGYRSEAYKDPVGIWTIGYGTTKAAGVGIAPKAGDVITKEEAEWYLQKAVNKFAADIGKSIVVPINENEFGAFASLAYNIGPGAFSRSSALRHFNEGNKDRAASSILLWNKATDPKTGKKVTLKGLTRRREAEKALFETLVPEKSKPIAKAGFWALLIAFIAKLIGGKK